MPRARSRQQKNIKSLNRTLHYAARTTLSHTSTVVEAKGPRTPAAKQAANTHLSRPLCKTRCRRVFQKQIPPEACKRKQVSNRTPQFIGVHLEAKRKCGAKLNHASPQSRPHPRPKPVLFVRLSQVCQPTCAARHSPGKRQPTSRTSQPTTSYVLQAARKNGHRSVPAKDECKQQEPRPAKCAKKNSAVYMQRVEGSVAAHACYAAQNKWLPISFHVVTG